MDLVCIFMGRRSLDGKSNLLLLVAVLVNWKNIFLPALKFLKPQTINLEHYKKTDKCEVIKCFRSTEDFFSFIQYYVDIHLNSLISKE